MTPLPEPRPSLDEAALALASTALMNALRELGMVFPRGQLDPRTVAVIEAAEDDLAAVVANVAMAGMCRRGRR